MGGFRSAFGAATMAALVMFVVAWSSSLKANEVVVNFDIGVLTWDQLIRFDIEAPVGVANESVTVKVERIGRYLKLPSRTNIDVHDLDLATNPTASPRIASKFLYGEEVAKDPRADLVTLTQFDFDPGTGRRMFLKFSMPDAIATFRLTLSAPTRVITLLHNTEAGRDASLIRLHDMYHYDTKRGPEQKGGHYAVPCRFRVVIDKADWPSGAISLNQDSSASLRYRISATSGNPPPYTVCSPTLDGFTENFSWQNLSATPADIPTVGDTAVLELSQKWSSTIVVAFPDEAIADDARIEYKILFLCEQKGGCNSCFLVAANVANHTLLGLIALCGVFFIGGTLSRRRISKAWRRHAAA